MSEQSKLARALQRADEDIRRQARRRRETRKQAARISDLIESADLVAVLDSMIIVEFVVESFAAAAPILEAIETRLGVEFDSTVDAAQYGWRECRTSGAKWLRVDLKPMADSAVCKAVVVGMKTEPVYAFDCSGAQA